MRGDMIETYKIISGLEDAHFSQFFIRSDMNNLHGHSLTLYKEHFPKVNEYSEFRSNFHTKNDIKELLNK